MKHIIYMLCLNTLLSVTVSANFVTGVIRRTLNKHIHTIIPNIAYRSGILSAKKLAQLIVKKPGIKTIINLCGKQPRKRWWVQQNAIARASNITRHDIMLSDTTMPEQQEVQNLLKIFETAPRPLLIQGKSGHIRTSLAAALFLLTQTKSSKAHAARQLSDSYGYFSSFYPVPRFFFEIIPDNTQSIEAWLQTYNPHDYPTHNAVASPRMYPTMNFGIVQPHALYRSAQLTPIELAGTIQRHKIKTIINLMGTKKHQKWWQFEHATAQRYGAQVHDVQLFVDALPPRETLHKILDLYDTAPRPILIHCRDGADRTGEVAALWRLHIQKKSHHQALKELSLRYFHFGIVHPAKKFFIEQWQSSEWARTTYDPYSFSQYQPPKTSKPM